MEPDTSFTERVRQELARRPIGGDPEVRAELSAIVRFAGSLTLRGGAPAQVGIEVATSSGAVARRTYALLVHRYGLRPELTVRAPGGVRRRTTYGVHVATGAPMVARDLSVLDADGRPVDGLPADLVGTTAVAYLRGALLGGGSVSSPGRAAHLEVPTTSSRVAAALAALIRQVIGGNVTVTDGDRPRVVLKSGERIGELMAAVGATGAFLTWDDRRLRRQLRNDANRLANADAANLRRSVEASAVQVAAVEAAIAAVGWGALDDDLRAIALTRLANPQASLGELGELVDPPVGKSAVHRRLRRLQALAEEAVPPGG